ncbi:peptidoglycan-binding protein [Streptomyces sp. NPDC101175]|uniref:peptidoglycan-binding protein n=1 Tax=Streptomyces sp. NPDC101175 TaxID=3366123 RepID=UPI003833D4DA
MARWKAIPAGLDQAVVEFVAEIRRLKDASGLSLRDLATGTGYSSSSWERYLGGRLLPPREAVESMAELVAADADRLLARYERARDAWRPDQLPATGTAVEPEAATAPAPEDVQAAPRAPVPAVLRRLLTIGLSAAAGAAIAVLAMQPDHGSSAAGTARAAAATQVPSATPYTCHYVRRAGLWYAGNSATRTGHLQVDMWGPEVAELQCLLQRAGDSPGGVDGNFGPLTESAVISAQKAFHLNIDGQVGPQTWAALRG